MLIDHRIINPDSGAAVCAYRAAPLWFPYEVNKVDTNDITPGVLPLNEPRIVERGKGLEPLISKDCHDRITSLYD